ncbi:orotate phosphoribosyltransferase [Cenarchaeum symbiosum A]|uniref:Orotate phosphoribosyltransferase n=1 Tax=Cenarchaeum symbiosum (strain A) TaxID=414004 RepID=PYRE_CENSY|nr:RecName: Full=Orotate phosphoribosyltransferase; Short=OPRT; Short=OPRTase [Cenarchaeum symbiosum A]ABK78302.1 orotate phosphoribosyltransferase [Cenarchaeum symbiosum A]
MGFVDGFSAFLHSSGAVKFGDFELSGGGRSPYYFDLRSVPSHPHQFRGMIRGLLDSVISEVGLDRFDTLASIPTGGLVVASALAIEAVKPLVYARAAAKGHGTGRTVEGIVRYGARALIIDDVATTGGSVIRAAESLRAAGAIVTDAFVVIDRMEGAEGRLGAEGIKLHRLAGALEVARSLHAAGLIPGDVMRQVEGRTR